MWTNTLLEGLFNEQPKNSRTWQGVTRSHREKIRVFSPHANPFPSIDLFAKKTSHVWSTTEQLPAIWEDSRQVYDIRQVLDMTFVNCTMHHVSLLQVNCRRGELFEHSHMRVERRSLLFGKHIGQGSHNDMMGALQQAACLAATVFMPQTRSNMKFICTARL